MPRDPFRRLFARLDGGPVILSADDRRELDEDWPALASAGLVAETTAATVVDCGACDEPRAAEVFPFETPGFPTRWFARCRACGAVPVDPDDLRRWAVRVPAVGRALTGRDAEERVPGLVWRLGPVGSGERVGWLVAGWRGRAKLAEVVPELLLSNAVVFVPCHLPPVAVWGTAPPVVVPAADVLRSDGTTLAVSAAALAARLPPEPVAVVEVDPRPRLSLPAGTRWEDVTLVVDDHAVELLVGGRRHRAEYTDLGLADGRNGSPGRAWHVLRLMARTGTLAPTDGVRTKPAPLKMHVGTLRDALRRWTGLPDDPFHPVRRLDPYRPRFRLRSEDTLEPA